MDVLERLSRYGGIAFKDYGDMVLEYFRGGIMMDFV